MLEVAPGVNGLARGDRVIGVAEWGDFCRGSRDTRRKRLSNSEFYGLQRRPAGFPVAYSTSYGALEWRARLKRGETVLVSGAAGGVGLSAVEVAKAMGATVIAMAGNAEKLALAKSHGADHVIDYGKENIRDRLREAHRRPRSKCRLGPSRRRRVRRVFTLRRLGRTVGRDWLRGREDFPSRFRPTSCSSRTATCSAFYWGAYLQKDPDKVSAARTRSYLAGFEEGHLRPHIHDLAPRTGRQPLDLCAPVGHRQGRIDARADGGSAVLQ